MFYIVRLFFCQGHFRLFKQICLYLFIYHLFNRGVTCSSLTSNSICIQKWVWNAELPVSTSWMLRLKACVALSPVLGCWEFRHIGKHSMEKRLSSACVKINVIISWTKYRTIWGNCPLAIPIDGFNDWGEIDTYRHAFLATVDCIALEL